MSDYRYKILGLKLTKSEPFLHFKSNEVIWDGVNKSIILSHEKEISTARLFAQAVKNNTPPKHWKIWIEDAETKIVEEIGYT